MSVMNFLQRAALQVDQNEAGLGGLPRAFTSDNIRRGLVIAFGIAGGVALIVVAYGGFKYTISQGNPQEINKAKNTILDGLIGLAIIVASGGIVSFVTMALT